MKRFTDAGRRAVAEKNFYAALSLALMVPDICASIEDPGPGKSQKRYVQWCRKWVEPKFTTKAFAGRPASVSLSAEDCYQLRCSLIHSGSSEIDPAKQVVLHRFEFFDDTIGAHLTTYTGNSINGVKQPNWLQLKADRFSQTMFDAADEWGASVKADVAIQAEKEKLLIIRSKGATIGGILFA